MHSEVLLCTENVFVDACDGRNILLKAPIRRLYPTVNMSLRHNDRNGFEYLRELPLQKKKKKKKGGIKQQQ